MCARINTPTDVYLLVDCDVNIERRQEQLDLAYYIASSLYPNADSNAVRLFVYSLGQIDGQGLPTLVHNPTLYSPVNERGILNNIYNYRTCSATSRTTLSQGINAIRRNAQNSNRNYMVAIITGRPDNELDSANQLSNSLVTLIDNSDRTQRVAPLVFYNNIDISETFRQVESQIVYLGFYPVASRMPEIASALCEALPQSVAPTQPPAGRPTSPSGKGFTRFLL